MKPDINFHAHMHVSYELFHERMKQLLSQAEIAARMGDEQAVAKIIQIMMTTLMTLSTDLKQEWENCQTPHLSTASPPNRPSSGLPRVT